VTIPDHKQVAEVYPQDLEYSNRTVPQRKNILSYLHPGRQHTPKSVMRRRIVPSAEYVVRLSLNALRFGRLQVLWKANAAFSPSPRSLGQLHNLFRLPRKQLLRYPPQFALAKCFDAQSVFSIRVWVLATFDSIACIRFLLFLLRCLSRTILVNSLIRPDMFSYKRKC
jgi:hypothetical protein